MYHNIKGVFLATYIIIILSVNCWRWPWLALQWWISPRIFLWTWERKDSDLHQPILEQALINIVSKSDSPVIIASVFNMLWATFENGVLLSCTEQNLYANLRYIMTTICMVSLVVILFRRLGELPIHKINIAHFSVHYLVANTAISMCFFPDSKLETANLKYCL